MKNRTQDEFSSRKVLIQSLGLLEKRDRRNILIVAFVQIFLSGLDLLGVAIIGVIGALAANGIAQKAPGDRASMFLRFNFLTGQMGL